MQRLRDSQNELMRDLRILLGLELEKDGLEVVQLQNEFAATSAPQRVIDREILASGESSWTTTAETRGRQGRASDNDKFMYVANNAHIHDCCNKAQMHSCRQQRCISHPQHIPGCFAAWRANRRPIMFLFVDRNTPPTHSRLTLNAVPHLASELSAANSIKSIKSPDASAKMSATGNDDMILHHHATAPPTPIAASSTESTRTRHQNHQRSAYVRHKC